MLAIPADRKRLITFTCNAAPHGAGKKVKIALDETRMLALGLKFCSGSSFAAFSVMATSSCQPMCAIWTGSRWR
jgi:hypothetical protein